MENSLAIKFPEIAQYWHPTKNGEVTPNDVTPFSHTKFWWKCSKGHEWEASVSNRSIGRGCPYCSNKKVCLDNCLETNYPEISKEWHPTKNGTVTPKEVISGTHKSFWFKCCNGHDWESPIVYRTSRKKSCPLCNSLIFKFPSIAKEWHPSKNGSRTPSNVSYGSNQMYWFICAKGHEWEAVLASRTGPDKCNCPYCSGQRVCLDNCLETNYPEISKEWHTTKNGMITPRDVAPQSKKMYWFKCEKGHEWEASLANRVGVNKTNCPYCSNKKVCLDNCLETNYPDISKEWHPTKNGAVTPRKVISKSNKKYWFKCYKGHEWKTSLSHRTHDGRGCPYCANSKVCIENCLETNYPEIAKEWHPTKNGDITPRDVISKSDKKYWFKCNLGHEWEASLYCRSIGSGCHYCLYKTQEKVREIFERLLNTKFPQVRPLFLDRLEYDGANEDLKLAWEYDGEYHDIAHYASKNPVEDLKKSKERDTKKDRLSAENGWTLIRIHHSKKDNLEDYIREELIKLNLLKRDTPI